jgi:hypothetical protein
MDRLLALIRDVCLLRAAPQDLPHSRGLFRNLLLLALAADLATRWWLGVQDVGLLLVVMAFLLRLGLVSALLHVAGRGERFLQTMSAMLAVGIAFTLLLAPVLHILLPLPLPGEAPTPMQGMMGWLALGIIAWNVTVDGHILRHALEIRLGQGVLLAVALLIVQFVASLMLARLLIDPAAVAA